MITVTGLELRAGARMLLDDVSFQIGPQDRIGLVGRNGAGKTTLTKVLAGEALPAGGTVTRTGSLGYLPQDPRTGDLDVLARDRILSARGLDSLIRKLEKVQLEMDTPDDAARDKAVEKYGRLEERFTALGGYAAESEAGRISVQPGPGRAHAHPAAAHPLRRPASPGRAGPDPVQRRRDAAARRADQPPRRRLDRLAARLPQEPRGRADRDQPRRRAARRTP